MRGLPICWIKYRARGPNEQKGERKRQCSDRGRRVARAQDVGAGNLFAGNEAEVERAGIRLCTTSAVAGANGACGKRRQRFQNDAAPTACLVYVQRSRSR